MPPSEYAAKLTGFRELSTPLQDDVERLIEIAAQLFGAIERQIHHIEQDLNYSQSIGVVTNHQTVFKEQLIRTAVNLSDSLNEIAVHLGDQARTALSPREATYLE